MSYHAKLTYGIQKYFTNFVGSTTWQASSQPDQAWQAAMMRNYGKAVAQEKAVPLRSVFQFLRTGDTDKNFAFPAVALDLDEKDFFPIENAAFDLVGLQDAFAKEWEKIKDGKPENVGTTLLYLAKKYLSKVAFSPEMPYISTFEHIKTTAAIAECIERGDGGKLLLVGVGLDNIQGFCYDIVSSKAAKSLKGRSFYLQMLLETIAQDILEGTHATQGHIIYARGGKMFLLLPDTADIRSKLDEIRENIIASFWTKFKTSLYIYLQYESFSAETSDQQAIWHKLNKSIKSDRGRKYQDLLITDYKTFFKPLEEGFEALEPVVGEGEGKKQFCRVTGEVINEADLKLNNLEASAQDEAPIWVSGYVKFQSDLGQQLPISDYYAYFKGEVALDDPHFMGSTSNFALPNETDLDTGLKPSQQRQLNNTHFLPTSPNGIAYGFSFYGGDKQPMKEVEGKRIVKGYEDLADVGEARGEKFTRLGVARMDVDNMGDLAKKANASFALNATFSTELDLFLSGYINTLWKSKDEYTEYINIVFAGGDDMLIVGRWDVVLDFVESFREKFRAFQGGRDDLSLSAALTLVTPKFPIAKAVAMTGEDLGKAKVHICDKDNPKNAFYFLDHPLNWTHEFPVVKELKNELVSFIKAEKLPRGLLIGFQAFHEQKKEQEKDVLRRKNILNDTLKSKEDKKSELQYITATPSWRWQLAYQLARLKNRLRREGKDDSEKKSDNETFKFLDDTATSIFTNRYNGNTLQSKYDFFDLLAIAARWGEYELRSQANKNDNHSNQDK
jgi:CRISPR-associated protein Csm1